MKIKIDFLSKIQIFRPGGGEMMVSERLPSSQELSTRGPKIFTKRNFFLT